MKKSILTLVAVLVFSAFCLSSCTDNNMITPDGSKTPAATLPGTKVPSTKPNNSTPTPDDTPDNTPNTIVTPSPDTVITPDISPLPDTIITPNPDTPIPDARHFSN